MEQLNIEPKQRTLVLGIESSCDETAASVVADGRTILSNVIASQADFHKQFGGVVPEIASRMHLEAILPVIDQALAEAGVGLADIDVIAVTYGPGLVGALLVGLTAAKSLALATGKPLVGIHHIAGHIAANYLADPQLEPPFLCLVASGGHSHLVWVEDYEHNKVLARTRDDAAGEAFDKIARAIGLGYPGGPLLDRAAQDGRTHAIELPRTRFADSLDFSFSGLKTAALNQLHHLEQLAANQGKVWQDLLPLADFAASFQQAVVDVLVDHTLQAAQQYRASRLAIAGGVAANRCLRRCLAAGAERLDLRLTCPPLILCTDNAAMIASAGFYAYRAGRRDDLTLNAIPSLDLEG
ncbi:MAG: tRNA (adenosine(37)-N6)-threonylcarbamoyltransferase complex transferase subunit TsaD [Clostridiaceae bacterium]|nr:tRNA (adenosine(37)-N6)-threonylcarbamoyltransferase complex transferase subunit TsaD [Clostridiaceae bacterium]